MCFHTQQQGLEVCSAWRGLCVCRNSRCIRMGGELHARILPHQRRGPTGGDAGDLQEIRVLNRVIRWLPGGITYEADPRHVEMLMKDFPPTSGTVRTAGTKSSDMADETLLEGSEVRKFRGGAARANYLAQDRPDISYPTKELCRRMHAPRRGDLRAL